MEDKIKFPQIKKSITDFIYEEEGDISRNKLMFIGSLLVIASVMSFGDNAFATHRSHSSHSSHSSSSYGGGSSSSGSSHSNLGSDDSGSSGVDSNQTQTNVQQSQPAPHPQLTPQVPQTPTATDVPK